MQESLSLRREAFVEESKIFEQEELDEYDKTSVHILVQHKESCRYVATARLIMKDLPSLTNPLFTIKKRPVDHGLGEISRICVPRGRIGGLNIKTLTSLALFAGIIRTSLNHKLTSWVTCMEPRLNKLLNKNHMGLIQISDLTKYYGVRAIYYSKIGDVVYNVHQKDKQLFYEMGKVYVDEL